MVPAKRLDDVGLLDADLDRAVRHRGRHRTAHDDLHLALHLIVDAELLEQLGVERPGARIGVPDRGRVEHGLLEGFGRADVALDGAFLHGDAVAGAGEFREAAGHDLAAHHQTVELIGRVGDQIGGRVGVDLLVQRIAGLEADDDLVAGRLLEPGREILHRRQRALIGQNRDLGRQRRCSAGEHARRRRDRDLRPDFHPQTEPHGNLPVFSAIADELTRSSRPSATHSGRRAPA